MTIKQYDQLQEEYEMLLHMIEDHDKKEPTKPNYLIGLFEWELLTTLEKSDLTTKWSAEYSLWREYLSALQYGAREASDALLKFRFDVIMEANASKEK